MKSNSTQETKNSEPKKKKQHKTALKLKCTLQNLLKKEVYATKVTPTITNEETLKNKINKYTMSLVHQLPF
jgi:hypothetical protein